MYYQKLWKIIKDMLRLVISLGDATEISHANDGSGMREMFDNLTNCMNSTLEVPLRKYDSQNNPIIVPENFCS